MRNGTQGAMIRGSRAITNLIDNVVGPNYWGYDNVDSLEYIKGTLAAVYYGGALTGSIIATTEEAARARAEHHQYLRQYLGRHQRPRSSTARARSAPWAR